MQRQNSPCIVTQGQSRLIKDLLCAEGRGWTYTFPGDNNSGELGGETSSNPSGLCRETLGWSRWGAKVVCSGEGWE